MPIKLIIYENKLEVAKKSARIFADAIRKKSNIILGLATGSTPIGLYKELIRMYKKEKLNFSQVRSFNLDEYLGLSGDHLQSYHYFMNTQLFNHININKSNIHIPSGIAKNLGAHCKEYEEIIDKMEGIDLQLLGIGKTGHIGFNEPGTSKNSLTHIVNLSEETIKDNSRFFEDISQVPKQAITMGISSILGAKKIILLATGKNKEQAVYNAIRKSPNINCPASFLQNHPDCTFIIDKNAGSLL